MYFDSDYVHIRKDRFFCHIFKRDFRKIEKKNMRIEFFPNMFNTADVACLFFYVSFLQGLTGARGYPGFPVGGCAFFDLIIFFFLFT